MDFSCIKAVFVGAMLLAGTPAWAQASPGPAPEDQEAVLLGLRTVDAESAEAAEDSCPTRDVFAENELAVSCNTGTLDFFARLEDACAEGRPKPHLACAVVMYVIDPSVPMSYRNENRLQPMMTIKVAQVVVPDGNLQELRAVVIESNGSSKHLSPQETNRLLATIRIANQVDDYPESRTGTIRKDRFNPVQNVWYHPALLVPWSESSKVMSAEAAKVHFNLPMHIIDDVETALKDMMDLFLRN